MPDVNVRYRGQPGKHMLALSSSQFDPFRTSERKHRNFGHHSKAAFIACLGDTTLLTDAIHATGLWGIVARSCFATSRVPGFVAPPGPATGVTVSAEITSAHTEHVTFGSNKCP